MKKIGERERQQNHLSACKCAHAASPSSRSQSWANVGSLKLAPHRMESAGISGSVKVTNTRQGVVP